MKISTRILGLLATAVVSLSLSSCGGGGGGGGGGGNSGGGGNNNAGSGGNNDTTTSFAPASLQNYNFDDQNYPVSARLSFGANTCYYSDGHGMTYSGSYTYQKTGPNEGELSFYLVAQKNSTVVYLRTPGTITCLFSSSKKMHIQGRVEQDLTHGSSSWSTYDGLHTIWYKQ